MNVLLRFYNLRGLHLLLLVLSGNLLLIWLTRAFLIDETVFYNSFGEQLTWERTLQLYANFRQLSWLSYIFNPLVLLIKFSLISFVLYLGIMFIKTEYSISLSSVLRVVIASEIAIMLGSLSKFTWFCLFAGNYSLPDIEFFYPASLINIFKITDLDKIWIYPLQTINIFHILYILLLSFGLTHICKIGKPDSEKIVLAAYLPSLLLWITLVMVLTVNITV